MHHVDGITHCTWEKYVYIALHKIAKYFVTDHFTDLDCCLKESTSRAKILKIFIFDFAVDNSGALNCINILLGIS